MFYDSSISTMFERVRNKIQELDRLMLSRRVGDRDRRTFKQRLEDLDFNFLRARFQTYDERELVEQTAMELSELEQEVDSYLAEVRQSRANSEMYERLRRERGGRRAP